MTSSGIKKQARGPEAGQVKVARNRRRQPEKKGHLYGRRGVGNECPNRRDDIGKAQ